MPESNQSGLVEVARNDLAHGLGAGHQSVGRRIPHESLDAERPVGEQLLCQFHRSVTSLVQNTSSLEDAYRALRVVVAAKNSIAEGSRQKLEFSDEG